MMQLFEIYKKKFSTSERLLLISYFISLYIHLYSFIDRWRAHISPVCAVSKVRFLGLGSGFLGIASKFFGTSLV